jgi:hypothetical protein
LISTDNEIIVNTEYDDVYENNFKEEIKINVKEISESIEKNRILFEGNFLEKIHTDLEEIKKKIK